MPDASQRFSQQELADILRVPPGETTTHLLLAGYSDAERRWLKSALDGWLAG